MTTTQAYLTFYLLGACTFGAGSVAFRGWLDWRRQRRERGMRL